MLVSSDFAGGRLPGESLLHIPFGGMGGLGNGVSVLDGSNNTMC